MPVLRNMQRLTLALAGLGVALATTSLAQAQDVAYPTRAVKILVAAAPGGNPDIIARALAQKLTVTLNAPFIVENAPGAGGVVAATSIVKSPPDGYTLFVADSGSLAIALATTAGLAYDPRKDFTPITALASVPTVLVVNPDLGFKDVKSFIAAMRAAPNKTNYGSPGIGSVHHITMAVFLAQSNIQLEHIAYRGGTPMVDALLRREVQAAWSGIPNVMEPIRLGKLQPLVVSTAERQPTLPNVPTLAEEGLGQFDIATMMGLVGPAGIPPAVVGKLEKAVATALREPDMTARLDSLGMTFAPEQGAAAYTAFISRDIDKYDRASKQAGLTKQ
ncbi:MULTISPECIES: tripartite tricarboxylate transporter substrate binding protein [unclassified Beijerinckia]|uniref:Bug family tripartite tricarboxylate transporter substrate binding protein n=1 Tax=unclassified Beijerinckia TaxID=2638183 RepID=UPI00089D1E64|nr:MULTISPECIES: tripartite tricarboxylate transporter substrate binding protein [unclassified Beijerinckia]MDH7795867.1 tripartite-type tricarboxylate transporter receptor subunit TctC [Beijerinckia sp. GAS462]SEC19885.1 Tripartite-type tricarboxylate transporter, receptor component TctC [Beijerinckia sp. 28-YEA-48]